MISITLPGEGQKVMSETFTWKLDWERIREARANDEGTYLLRTNLPECDPKTLWKRYMIQGEIEYAFRELKNDLGLTPRQIIDKFRTVKMVDVVMPTADGRIVTLPRYVEPKQDLVILLDRLGLTMPAQPHRRFQAKRRKRSDPVRG